jgi:cyclopropane-fatty-acyl-phospholipid synthase
VVSEGVAVSFGIDLAERGWLPDFAIRWGIRRLLAQRLRDEKRKSCVEQAEAMRRFLDQMDAAPVAVETRQANQQHYEVPAGFYQKVLGKRLKYSSCVFATPTTSLDDAEEAMLRLTCERAELRDGMDVLELGCGWGSLSLWMAEKYPNSRILAVSNSRTQKTFIDEQARMRGFGNLEIQTCDMNQFTTDRRFDRVVSVEMFEHMRNWPELLRRVAGWLRDEGKLFLHVFCHREHAYPFETDGDSNWMGRHFFTGGIMPSDMLPWMLQRDLLMEQHWRVSGLDYALTSEAWLRNLDRQRDEIESLFVASHGADAQLQVQRWRMFFLAVAELFAYRGGDEWHVGHYRMVKR